MKRVLLLDMPLHTPEVPSIALGLLKAGVERAGIPCDVLYLNLDFMERVCRAQGNVVAGVDAFVAYREMGAHFVLLADWLFASDLFGRRADAGPGVEEVVACTLEQLHSPWAAADVELQAMASSVLQMRAEVGPFLDDCLPRLESGAYDIVGFTCTYTQGAASLALARRLKERYPEKTILFGGPNCEQEMGEALHRLFPFVDVVCSGKADWVLPELVRRLRSGEDLGSLPNIAFRRDGASHSTMRRPPLCGPIDELPYPDYGDYFTQLEHNALSGLVKGWLPFETSRGCWWGERSQCTFCGSNGTDMAYASKSPGHALAELAYLSERYRPRRMLAVDNILDREYFRTVLPALKASHRGLQLFYETKANLTKEQVRLLKEAGVVGIQPGIESLSTPILRLMRKGTTALQNVQLLKWAREAGLQVSWNLLMGFPGEDPAEYARMAGMVPALIHLQPPRHCCLISLQRFSPYFYQREALGVCNVRPLVAYRAVYPFPDEDLAQLAYFFNYDYLDGRDPLTYVLPLAETVAAWQEETGAGLAYSGTGEALLVRDARGPAVTWVRLRGPQCAVYEFCDEAHTLPAIEAQAQRACGEPGGIEAGLPGDDPAGAVELEGLREGKYSHRGLERLLAELVDLRLMLCDDGHYLSLAIRDHGEMGAGAASGRP